jgi:hypothetical protein
MSTRGTARQQVAAMLRTRPREGRQAVEQFEQDGERLVVKAMERHDRVWNDYTEGRLPAEDWNAARDELKAGIAATEAKLAVLRKTEQETRDAVDLADAERDTNPSPASVRRWPSR